MIPILFVVGNETDASNPRFIAKASLDHRLAVIQHGGPPEPLDTNFEEPLWRALLEFVSKYDESGDVFVAKREQDVDRKEIPISAYLQEWDATPPEDRSPPEIILLRAGMAIRICMLREYWNRYGGPYPYADSYTYSLFSQIDLSALIPEHLQHSSSASRWKIIPELINADGKKYRDLEKLAKPLF